MSAAEVARVKYPQTEVTAVVPAVASVSGKWNVIPPIEPTITPTSPLIRALTSIYPLPPCCPSSSNPPCTLPRSLFFSLPSLSHCSIKQHLRPNCPLQFRHLKSPLRPRDLRRPFPHPRSTRLGYRPSSSSNRRIRSDQGCRDECDRRYVDTVHSIQNRAEAPWNVEDIY